MSWKSTADRYGLIAIAIHWVSAAAIFALFGLGCAAANAADPATKAALLRGHVPLGIAIVVLTLLRLVWWRLDRRPAPLPGVPSWQEHSERLVRAALYALILVMGVSGIGLMIASGAPGVLFFGEPGPLPDLWAFPPMYGHFTAAVLLLGLAVLHIVAAIYHQLIRQDRLIARMWR
jgi:cytochrome b561